MIAVIGFLALHALLVGTGLAVMRAFGFLRVNPRACAAALGPALLLGASLVLPLLILGLVIGIPLTPVTAALLCLLCVGVAEIIARRRGVDPEQARVGAPAGSSARDDTQSVRWFTRAACAVAAGYVAFGAFALARLPTVGDDARIWSVKGLTLAYYHGLQPEIFQNPQQAGAHPVYPLFQPALEALLSQVMGQPQLRLYHAELWLLFAAALWTVGYLIAKRRHLVSNSLPIWVGVLALIAVTPAPAVYDLVLGDADVLGSVLLAAGALAIALWLERDDARFLALAPVLLGAAANTKDEELIAALLVLVSGGVIALLRRGKSDSSTSRRFLLWAAAAGYFAVAVAPWRIWLAAHHLSDAVVPPLPRALNPAYILGRSAALHRTATAMLMQVLQQWGWLAALFVAVCVICLITRTARRPLCFYITTVAALVLALLWLYTTTPLDLTFLLNTSMDRTVDVFVVPAAVATTHLLATLLTVKTSRSDAVRAG